MIELSPHRLPTNVKPSKYALKFEPDLVALTFTGRADVQIKVVQETSKIVINSIELELSNIIYKDEKTGNEFNTTNVSYDTDAERATLEFGTSLPAESNGTLSITFKGTLNDKLRGFYRQKYTVINEKTGLSEDRYSAVTQLASVDARRMFPCWDEPAIKATFDITLVVPTDRVALANTDIVSDVVDPTSGKRVVTFGPTPIMSTYLVAVAVGEFDHVESRSKNGVQVRVYTPLGKKDQGLFSLKTATGCLDYYEEYFGISYPLPKMDLIALQDMALGAMENWGLITFRESTILIDEVNSSSFNKHRVALIVTHEIAHQWFGNLVTMEWWTHLWLNEGFASFMEYLATHHLYPEFQVWEQFIIDERLRALYLDALHSSHPIEIVIGHPSEVNQIFDAVTYAKGAAILRMLHNYIGDADFRKGMNLYLNRHAYGNAATEQLWDALQEASGKPIGDLMRSWTSQKGFPVVSVKSVESDGKNILHFSQRKFASDGKLQPQEENLHWMIPITIKAGNNAPINYLLENQTGQLEIPGKPSDAVCLNPDSIGFFRTKYSDDLMASLINGINDGTVSAFDACSDMYSFVSSGQAKTVQLLDLIKVVAPKADQYPVWVIIRDAFYRINTLLSYTDFQSSFHAYARQHAQAIHAKLGWEKSSPSESILDNKMRTLIIDFLITFGDEATIAEALKRYKLHLEGTAFIPADLRSAVYTAVSKNGTDELFDSLIELYKSSELHQEKDRIGYSLGATSNPDRVSRVLKFAISEHVRAQDSVFIILCAANSRVGVESAWQLLQENKDELIRRYAGGYLVDRFVKETFKHFASDEAAMKVKEFFEANEFAGADRAVLQAIETIRLNAAWLSRDQEDLKKFVSSQISA